MIPTRITLPHIHFFLPYSTCFISYYTHNTHQTFWLRCSWHLLHFSFLIYFDRKQTSRKRFYLMLSSSNENNYKTTKDGESNLRSSQQLWTKLLLEMAIQTNALSSLYCTVAWLHELFRFMIWNNVYFTCYTKSLYDMI